MRRSNSKKHMNLRKILILIIFLIMMIIISVVVYKKQVGPNIDAVSILKAKGMITEIINQTMEEGFKADKQHGDFFEIIKDKDDKLQMVQPNTSLINEMISSFASKLQQRYNDIKETSINLSYGTLTGSKILSQTNLSVKIKILPLSVSKCDFETQFESQGINQTKYKIYILIESSIRVLKPFSASNITVKNKMLIAEAVILGEVPGSYVMVPEEDILDVTNE